MDTGLFRRSPLERWAWILFPPLLLATLFFGVQGFCTHTAQSLKRQQQIVELLPTAGEGLARAGSIIREYELNREERNDPEGNFVKHFNNSVQAHQLKISSLKFEKSDIKPGELTRIVTIRVGGEASLANLVALFERLPHERSLFIVESAVITAAEFRDEVTYNGTFVLSYHGIAGNPSRMTIAIQPGSTYAAIKP